MLQFVLEILNVGCIICKHTAIHASNTYKCMRTHKYFHILRNTGRMIHPHVYTHRYTYVPTPTHPYKRANTQHTHVHCHRQPRSPLTLPLLMQPQSSAQTKLMSVDSQDLIKVLKREHKIPETPLDFIAACNDLVKSFQA